MSKVIKNFRASQAEGNKPTDALNMQTNELDLTSQTDPAEQLQEQLEKIGVAAPHLNLEPINADEFTKEEDSYDFIKERDPKRIVDKFVKFANDKETFIGRFLEVWGEDSLTAQGTEIPFQGVVFTEGNSVQGLNSDICLLPSHSQLVQYFSEKGVVGVLYKIERVEKLELKGGRTFVKFNIFVSNK
jgi:hypothetical protein